jgi:hypothetical protein
MAFRVSDGNAIEQILELTAGYAIGGATTTALEPLLQSLRSKLWLADPSLPTDAETLALVVRLGWFDLATARGEAGKSGVGQDSFDRYLQSVSQVPDTGTLLALTQRALLDTGDLKTHLERSGVDPRYSTAVIGLLRTPLSPAEAAIARQQGFITPEQQYAYAALAGVEQADADLQFEVAGLPPGAAEAGDLANRGLIDRDTFDRIIAEGHTKTKYSDVLWEARAARITPGQAVDAAIRQWITPDDATGLLALWGYDDAQAQILLDTAGRPPGPGQLQTAFNRGLLDRDRFDHGIAESDVRPEWSDVLFGLRFHYPSLFQMKTLVADGAITPERAKVILGYEGYEPVDADAMVAAWAGSSATAAKKLLKGEVLALYEGRLISVSQARTDLAALGEQPEAIDLLLVLGDARRDTKYREALISKTAALYVSHKLDRADAVNELDSLGIPSEARDLLLSFWDAEREVNALQLTPAEIVDLVVKDVVTPQVGHDMLVDRGAGDMTAWLRIAARIGPIPGTPVGTLLQSVPSS